MQAKPAKGVQINKSETKMGAIYSADILSRAPRWLKIGPRNKLGLISE